MASALLVAAVVPALRAVTIAHMSGTRIEQKTQAAILAQSKLDEIRARSVHHYGTSFQESSGGLQGRYLCHVTDDEDPDLRLVTVSAGYDRDGNGYLGAEETAVTLTTYIARRQ